jgi:hypothetical protein
MANHEEVEPLPERPETNERRRRPGQLRRERRTEAHTAPPPRARPYGERRLAVDEFQQVARRENDARQRQFRDAEDSGLN